MNLEKKKTNKSSKMRKLLIKELILVCLSIITLAITSISLSSAWFTNVSKTDNINLKVTGQGFDSANISLNEEYLNNIYPGSCGVLDFEITNTDIDYSINVDVTVDKSSLYSDENDIDNYNTNFRKRIFFYVDQSKYDEESGETVDRIYVGTDSMSYRYVLQAGSVLSINDEFCSDAPLMYTWVYDVTGYYFKGSIENDTVYVNEYIRPIEYDVDDATYDDNGKLVTVSGNTLDTFLLNISSKDGYVGTFGGNSSSGIVEVDGCVYYKVSVENNSGIYAYLCDMNEIEAYNSFDSNVVKNLSLSLSPKIEFAISKNSLNYSEIYNVEDLKAIIEDEESDYKYIKLENDLVLKGSVDIADGKNVYIDLNDMSIVYGDSNDNDYNMFNVQESSSLTLINGKIIGNNADNGINSDAVAIGVSGGTVCLNNVNIDKVDTALEIDDSDTLKLFDNTSYDVNAQHESVVQINNCNLYSNNQTVFVKGNGLSDGNYSKLEIVNSIIHSNNYIGLCGSGVVYNSTNKLNDCYGTNISIRNSDVFGKAAGIYLPQQASITNINSSTISGNIGICLKGGTLNITSSTITGLGDAYTHEDAAYKGSGFRDTGDGIYVDSSFNWSIYLNIIGEDNTIKSEKNYALQLFGVENDYQTKVVVEGGTFIGVDKALAYNNIDSVFKVYGINKNSVGTYNDEGIIFPNEE